MKPQKQEKLPIKDNIEIDRYSKMKNSTVFNPDITCVARSAICFDNEPFKQFKILTLHIEKGKVVKMDLSDTWASFETIANHEHFSLLSLLHLNNNWAPGKTMCK